MSNLYDISNDTCQIHVFVPEISKGLGNVLKDVNKQFAKLPLEIRQNRLPSLEFIIRLSVISPGQNTFTVKTW